MPNTRTRPTREQTRQVILAAALEVFGREGIARSSLSEVAAAADLTKGAVYSNFASKDDLVLALMEEQVMHRLTAGLDGVSSASDPHDVVEQVARVLVREMHDDAAWHRLLAEYFAMAHRDPKLADALRERRREAREAVTRALERLSRLLDISWPLPAADMSTILFALSNGLAIESGIDPDGVPDRLLLTVLNLLAPEALTTITELADN